jgi:hypothetical protein
MKNNVMPVYATGTAHRFTVRNVGESRKISIPYYNFQDRYSETLWQKYAAKRLHQAMPENPTSVNHFLKEVRQNRMSDQTRIFIYTRKGASRVRDVLGQTSFMQRIQNSSLTPNTFKYERALGIEIECLRPYGREVVLPLWSRSSGDGSIRSMPNTDPIEYKLLLKRSELEMRLHKFCSLISDHKVNTSCGLHVHLDCRGRTESDVRAIAKRMTAWLIALKEFVPESRRNNTDYAALSFSETNRYRAVNFTAFAKYKTLEIRLHSGTVDYTKIIAWVRLCELLFVLPTKPRAGAQGVAALSQLPLPEYERSYWLKRHAQLNPRQYTSTTPSTEIE